MIYYDKVENKVKNENVLQNLTVKISQFSSLINENGLATIQTKVQS